MSNGRQERAFDWQGEREDDEDLVQSGEESDEEAQASSLLGIRTRSGRVLE